MTTQIHRECPSALRLDDAYSWQQREIERLGTMVKSLAEIVVKAQYCPPNKPCGNAGIHCLECVVKWAALQGEEAA